MFSGGGSVATRSYYDELINTGNLQLIRKDTIKNAIAQYYGRLDIYEQRSYVSKSRFSSFTGELRPFDPSKPSFISKYDQSKMIKAFKTKEFEKIVNLELSYAYETSNNVRKQKERAALIIKLINKELRGEL